MVLGLSYTTQRKDVEDNKSSHTSNSAEIDTQYYKLSTAQTTKELCSHGVPKSWASKLFQSEVKNKQMR
jgi:hypothetical protein